MRLLMMLTVLLAGEPGVLPAAAQESLAKRPGLTGHNTIQQPPSGGAATGRLRAHAPTDDGRPTPDDRRQEQQDNAASQICKGC